MLQASSHFAELYYGPLADRADGVAGRFHLPIWAVNDARSVFDCIAAIESKHGADPSLVYHVRVLKDLCDKMVVEWLVWCDTRDMIVDALTKGAIDRAALNNFKNSGLWKVEQQPSWHQGRLTSPDKEHQKPYTIGLPRSSR